MPRETSPAFIRTILPLLTVPAVTGILDGTGALTLVTSLPVGYRCWIEKVTYISGTVHTGSGGTQTFKVRRGGASGSVVATLTVALADVDTAVGRFKQASVAAADDEAAKLQDSDTISLTRESGGTAFSAGSGMFYLILRQRPQARA